RTPFVRICAEGRRQCRIGMVDPDLMKYSGDHLVVRCERFDAAGAWKSPAKLDHAEPGGFVGDRAASRDQSFGGFDARDQIIDAQCGIGRVAAFRHDLLAKQVALVPLANIRTAAWREAMNEEA